MRVILTRAAGHLGRLVAERLLERLEPDELILVTRRPDALREWGGATVRYGDFDDPASLEAAFQGADRMLLIGTDALGRRARQHRAAIEAATRVGVRHIVFTSLVTPSPRIPSDRSPPRRSGRRASSTTRAWTGRCCGSAASPSSHCRPPRPPSATAG